MRRKRDVEPCGVIESADPGDFAGMQAAQVESSRVGRDLPPDALAILLRRLPLAVRFSRSGRLMRRMIREGIRQGRAPADVLSEISDTVAALEGSSLVRCVSCEAVILSAEWRGRAVVRCGACGERMGVDIGDYVSSVWSLDVPE
jgi:hypothetical protein